MNYNIDQIEDKVRANLNPKRFAHTQRVVETALKIGEKYNLDADKIKVAALLHDYAKNYRQDELISLCNQNNVKLDDFQQNNKELIHSVLGAAIAQNVFGIDDKDILNAIENHTTGREDMSLLEMVIYVSDFCEPGRRILVASKVYEIAMIDLKEATYMALNSSIMYLLTANKEIDIKSIKCRNWLLNNK